jgi:hypothetical protein
LTSRADVAVLDEGATGYSFGIGAAAALSGAYALALAALGTAFAVWRDVP